jgi:predicted HTH domain antitoxin
MIATSDLIVPREFLESANMSEDEMRIDLAVHLYATRRLSMGKAKKLAGLDLFSFQKEMAKRDVYLNYDVEELKKDIETMERLRPKLDHDRS